GPPNVFGGNTDDLQPGHQPVPAGARTGRLDLDRRRTRGAGRWGSRNVRRRDVASGRDSSGVHKGMCRPRAETPTHYMTMGLHEDLNQAAKIATREMLNFVVETKGLPRDDVLMLLSAAMDLHVTEIVDVTKGVHAMLPKAIFQK